jgi:hypothetical protein
MLTFATFHIKLINGRREVTACVALLGIVSCSPSNRFVTSLTNSLVGQLKPYHAPLEVLIVACLAFFVAILRCKKGILGLFLVGTPFKVLRRQIVAIRLCSRQRRHDRNWFSSGVMILPVALLEHRRDAARLSIHLANTIVKVVYCTRVVATSPSLVAARIDDRDIINILRARAVCLQTRDSP